MHGSVVRSHKVSQEEPRRIYRQTRVSIKEFVRDRNMFQHCMDFPVVSVSPYAQLGSLIDPYAALPYLTLSQSYSNPETEAVDLRIV